MLSSSSLFNCLELSRLDSRTVRKLLCKAATGPTRSAILKLAIPLIAMLPAMISNQRFTTRTSAGQCFHMPRPRMHLLESVVQNHHSGGALFSTSVRNGITPGTSHLSHISSTLLWK
jgi:hypothetical protein